MPDRDGQLSKELEWLVQNELASLEQSYASGEALGMPAHCLFGVEIDYVIRMDESTTKQGDVLEASRTTIASALSCLAPKDEEQAQRKADWLRQIPDLTWEELITYHIYRRLSVPTLDPPEQAMYLRADDSPETTLEFAFGNGIYQTGYYDNPSFFEMRTQAAKPTIAMERVRRAMSVGEEVAQFFGARFAHKGDHTNFSVGVLGDRGLQPLHALDKPKGQEIARRATAGILHAVRDGMIVQDPPSVISVPYDKPLQLKAAPERGGTLRVLPNRFERRTGAGKGGHELSALILMSGFAYGVTDPALDTNFVSKESQLLLAPGPGYDKAHDLHLLRALQQSEVIEGRFVFPGISAFELDRIENTLSSIIGAEVYVHGEASARVIEELLGCVTLGPNAILGVDELAFEEVLNDAYDWITIQGDPSGVISERLQHIRCKPHNVTITGAVDYTWPSAVTFHDDLKKMAAAPSLEHIGQSVREAVWQEYATAFTHDEAVAQYCGKIMDTTSGPIDEKLARLQEALDQFPQANADKVMHHMWDNLQQRANRLAASIVVYESKQASAYDALLYEHGEQRHAEYLALLKALGAAPNNKNVL